MNDVCTANSDPPEHRESQPTLCVVPLNKIVIYANLGLPEVHFFLVSLQVFRGFCEQINVENIRCACIIKS